MVKFVLVFRPSGKRPDALKSAFKENIIIIIIIVIILLLLLLLLLLFHYILLAEHQLAADTHSKLFQLWN